MILRRGSRGEKLIKTRQLLVLKRTKLALKRPNWTVQMCDGLIEFSAAQPSWSQTEKKDQKKNSRHSRVNKDSFASSRGPRVGGGKCHRKLRSLTVPVAVTFSDWMPAKGHAPPPEDEGGDSSRAGCQKPAPLSTLSAARDTLTNLTVPKSGRFSVQDAVSSRRLIESIQEKYSRSRNKIQIQHKHANHCLVQR